MSAPTVTPGTARVGLYIAVCVIAVIAWFIQSGTPSFFPPASDKPTEWQQMALQVASESTRLLTTLASALLGGLGLLLSDKFSKGTQPQHTWAAIVSAMGAGLSLFFGYVVHLHLLWMVGNKVFDPTSPLFVLPSHYQFYTLLVAAFFLAAFVVHNLGGERST
jgi:hypothetical protein